MDEFPVGKKIVKVKISESLVLDKFSCMTVDIVHKIMFLLPRKDLTRLGAVSKFFLGAFQSLPVIDIDFDLFRSKVPNASNENWAKELFSFVSDSVQIRDQACVSIERVTFTGKKFPQPRADTDDVLYVSNAIDVAAKFASERDAKELVLDFLFNNVPILSHNVFRARSIRTMKLSGLNLDIPCESLVLDCPLLEEFSLVSCSFPSIDTAVKFASPSLKAVKFYGCGGLRKIEIDGPTVASLESFWLMKITEIPCEIVSLNSCTNLRYLELEGQELDDEPWFTDHTVDVSVFPALVVLKLIDCTAIKIVSALGNNRLKTLSLLGCKALEKINVNAPNLVSFEHSLYPVRDNKPCKINIDGCESIRDLRLRNVTDLNLAHKMSAKGSAMFCSLENLVLEGCNLVTAIEFWSKSLKRLELLHCKELREIAIDARSLVSFVYYGPVLSLPPIITSGNLEAELGFDFIDNDYICEVYTNFISHLGHCKTLTLMSKPEKGLYSFPSEVRDRLVSPLYDLQHLNVKFRTEILNTEELIDGLLWLAPRPKTISITFGSRLYAILKFYYDPSHKFNKDEKNATCCKSLVVKCWRHNLSRIEVEAFEGFGQDYSDLLSYFSQKNANLTLSMKRGSQKTEDLCPFFLSRSP